ncbi:hypothetical protein AB0J81_32225 [Streptomyces bobili]
MSSRRRSPLPVGGQMVALVVAGEAGEAGAVAEALTAAGGPGEC